MTNTSQRTANHEAVDNMLLRVDLEIARQSKNLLGLIAKRTAFRFLRDLAVNMAAASTGAR